jgi:hypothetical protein
MATDRVNRSILATQAGFVASGGIMKKIFIGIVALIVVMVTTIGVAVTLFLDSGIKRGVETLGPQLTKGCCQTGWRQYFAVIRLGPNQGSRRG